MRKRVISAIAVNGLISMAYAGGNTEAEKVVVETVQGTQEKSFIKTVNGYIRGGYQADGEGAKDLALGGKLHVETNAWHGLVAGASFYTTHVVGSNDGAGMSFFDVNHKSYSILGEAYIQATLGNTFIKVGRQEIDTPFLDTDDLGMVPNTFEAALLINKDLTDTTITMAHIEKMAGISAEINPAQFENIRDNDYVQILGVTYEASENLILSSWYYKLKNPLTDNLVYADVTYTGKASHFMYELGAQYAHRNLSDDTHSDADIFGALLGVSFEEVGLHIGVAYNTAQDNSATNGFGGGPFYTSAEHLTLREGNDDSHAYKLSAGWDAGTVGLEGLGLGVDYLKLEAHDDSEATELALKVSYTMSDSLSLDVIYSDVEDNINDDTFENTRVFANYLF